MRDEVTFIQNVRSRTVRKVDFTFFASIPESTRKNWKTARKAGSAIIDLSFALWKMSRKLWCVRPGSSGSWDKALTPELQPGAGGRGASCGCGACVASVASCKRLRRMKQAVATVFEPASEHGQKGMDELHEQTVNLLSFQQLPKNVFDVQVAFNMVARYGEQSVPALATVQASRAQALSENCCRRRCCQCRRCLLVQAPIFHGHAFAIHLELGHGRGY